jgi:2-amino-4-hydroxy-6-hydroxymethyldihydropteridine diphosphokinase
VLPQVTAYVALGSNLGDRRAALGGAITALAQLPGTILMAASPVIETAPVGPVEQGPFLNAVVAVQTTLTPRELLAALHNLERRAGRHRRERWGPRTLDLDLLLYGCLTLDEPGLTIPHPRLHERRFVLQPLAAIASHVVIPGLGQTVSRLLRTLPPE